MEPSKLELGGLGKRNVSVPDIWEGGRKLSTSIASYLHTNCMVHAFCSNGSVIWTGNIISCFCDIFGFPLEKVLFFNSSGG